MEKVYGSPKRQDGLYKVGKNEWELIYGFGEDENGGWNWRQRFTPTQPTREEILSVIKKQIDISTDEKIANGMKWNEKPVKLDTEAQTNILGILVNVSAVGDAMFPMTFKLGDDANGDPVFHEFENAQEFGAFALAATNHKQNAYSEGWQEKLELETISFDARE